jgi:hypothetical protein
MLVYGWEQTHNFLKHVGVKKTIVGKSFFPLVSLFVCLLCLFGHQNLVVLHWDLTLISRL